MAVLLFFFFLCVHIYIYIDVVYFCSVRCRVTAVVPNFWVDITKTHFYFVVAIVVVFFFKEKYLFIITIF